MLPDRRLVAAALHDVGVEIDPALVPRAHYRAVRALDRGAGDGYLQSLCRALGVAAERWPDAIHALARVADRERSGQILWSEPAPGAVGTLIALRRAGVAVVVVTNSDGHGAENLRDSGICATAPGTGAVVTKVVDSAVVGYAKPDPMIFRIALRWADVAPEAAAHVGDMLSWDVAGAAAAGITPIHLDPGRSCRAGAHRHLRTLSGIWRHVRPCGHPPATPSGDPPATPSGDPPATPSGDPPATPSGDPPATPSQIRSLR